MLDGQREQRNDGLADVRCPYCRSLWYRMQPVASTVTHETRCPSTRCKRFVLYHVELTSDGQLRVRDLAATQL